MCKLDVTYEVDRKRRKESCGHLQRGSSNPAERRAPLTQGLQREHQAHTDLAEWRTEGNRTLILLISLMKNLRSVREVFFCRGKKETEH